MMFFLLPGSVLGLSIIPGAGFWPLAIIGGLFVLISFIAIVINIMQNKCSQCLPNILQTWDFLPIWMHSLDPLDVGCMAILKYLCICCPNFYNSLKTELPTLKGREDEEVTEVVTKQPKAGVVNTSFHNSEENLQESK